MLKYISLPNWANFIVKVKHLVLKDFKEKTILLIKVDVKVILTLKCANKFLQ